MMRTLGCDRGASGSDLGRTSQARSAPSFAVARPAAELAHFDLPSGTPAADVTVWVNTAVQR